MFDLVLNELLLRLQNPQNIRISHLNFNLLRNKLASLEEFLSGNNAICIPYETKIYETL